MIRSPSFNGFRASSPASSRAKQANRSVNTNPELLLSRALRTLGLRFRTNVVKLPGKPDVVFTRARVVVFCDGDFWHGRNWSRLRLQLQRRANAAYWIPKISANRARDIRSRRALRRDGWVVIRVWETDLRRNPARIASAIQGAVSASERDVHQDR
jgi:DNA mismatch endonuclease (patch repair protein)